MHEHDRFVLERKEENPENHPIYDVDTDMSFSIFYNDLCFEESELKECESKKNEENQKF